MLRRVRTESSPFVLSGRMVMTLNAPAADASRESIMFGPVSEMQLTNVESVSKQRKP